MAWAVITIVIVHITRTTPSTVDDPTPSQIPARVQELINGAEVKPNTVLNVSEESILKTPSDVERFIYDSINEGYTYNWIAVESIELLQPEEYYTAHNPGASSIVFSDAKIYTNTAYLKCTYNLTQISFLSGPRWCLSPLKKY